MYIIKHLEMDSFSHKINELFVSYLCKGNGCNGSDKPFYSFYHDYKPVYFKEQWQAFMYLTYYYTSNSKDVYRVEWVNDPINEQSEIFDPAIWDFVNPDDEYKNLAIYNYKMKDMILTAENILQRYSDLKKNVEELSNDLIHFYYKRPNRFRDLWNHSYFHELRNQDFAKDLFKRVDELMIKHKEKQT